MVKNTCALAFYLTLCFYDRLFGKCSKTHNSDTTTYYTYLPNITNMLYNLYYSIYTCTRICFRSHHRVGSKFRVIDSPSLYQHYIHISTNAVADKYDAGGVLLLLLALIPPPPTSKCRPPAAIVISSFMDRLLKNYLPTCGLLCWRWRRWRQLWSGPIALRYTQKKRAHSTCAHSRISRIRSPQARKQIANNALDSFASSARL